MILPPLVFPGWLLCFVYFLVGWHAGAFSLALGDIIFAKLAYPLRDVIVANAMSSL
jgi:hypothetical protein